VSSVCNHLVAQLEQLTLEQWAAVAGIVGALRALARGLGRFLRRASGCRAKSPVTSVLGDQSVEALLTALLTICATSEPSGIDALRVRLERTAALAQALSAVLLNLRPLDANTPSRDADGDTQGARQALARPPDD
jgi:hypothetical protein